MTTKTTKPPVNETKSGGDDKGKTVHLKNGLTDRTICGRKITDGTCWSTRKTTCAACWRRYSLNHGLEVSLAKAGKRWVVTIDETGKMRNRLLDADGNPVE